MASKKQNSKKKKVSKPKLGVLDHLISLFEEIVSYFEVLFIYLKKQFNQNLRSAILSVLIIIYFLFLMFVGSSFLLHAGYLGLLLFTNGNPILTSLILGISLVLISLVVIRYFLKKISI